MISHIAAHAQVHHVEGLEDHEEQDAEHHEQQQGEWGEEIRTMKLYVKFFLFHTNSPFVVGTTAHPLSLKKIVAKGFFQYVKCITFFRFLHFVPFAAAIFVDK